MTHCLMGMGLGVALLLAFGVEAGTVAAVGVALLCPLMMVLCMGHMFRHGSSHPFRPSQLRRRGHEAGGVT